MSKYKVGDKVVFTVTGINEEGYVPYYEFNNNLNVREQSIDKYTESLSTYIEPLEDTIQKYTVKIARLVMEKEGLKDENERLKAENEKMSVKIDAYELYGDQHEEEYNQAFNQGADKAWELARKIVRQPINGGYKRSEFEEIFGCGYISDIFEKYTYPEAAAKLAEWEKAKEEIKVGDIVKIREGNNNDLCVLCMSTDKKYYNAVDGYGAVYYLLTKEMIAKTGRHIDIDGFLKQIGGEE